MDNGKFIFTSPDFYAFAVRGLEQEAIRRIQSREPVSGIEEWILTCDQLAGASAGEIESVLSSLFEGVGVSQASEESPETRESADDGSENENPALRSEHKETEQQDDQQKSPTPPDPFAQDPFGFPSFKNLSQDIYEDLSEETGINVDGKEGS